MNKKIPRVERQIGISIHTIGESAVSASNASTRAKDKARFMLSYTGVLILQNAKGLFLSQDLARANYRAESAEILHGTLLRDSTWVNRGVF